MDDKVKEMIAEQMVHNVFRFGSPMEAARRLECLREKGAYANVDPMLFALINALERISALETGGDKIDAEKPITVGDKLNAEIDGLKAEIEGLRQVISFAYDVLSMMPASGDTLGGRLIPDICHDYAKSILLSKITKA